MDRIEQFTLARACVGVTDDEFYWEPAPSSWSVRRRDECHTSTPFGNGAWLVDFEVPEPTPVPITSIAWLFWHIGSLPARLTDIDFLGGSRTIESGWTSPYLTHHPIFISAADATTALRDGWGHLRAVIESATDEQLETPSRGYTYAAEPMRDGLCVLGLPGPEHPGAFFVAGALNEVSHHATQICMLRDLYAHHEASSRP
jgi:hypothetical protein